MQPRPARALNGRHEADADAVDGQQQAGFEARTRREDGALGGRLGADADDGQRRADVEAGARRKDDDARQRADVEARVIQQLTARRGDRGCKRVAQHSPPLEHVGNNGVVTDGLAPQCDNGNSPRRQVPARQRSAGSGAWRRP